MKTTATLLVALLLASRLNAQTQPAPCPGGSSPNDICANACISCNFQNGTVNNTGNYSADYPDNDCLFVHNNYWYAFIAGQTTATFTGTPSNCSNQGIQMALYDACDGPCLYLDYGCNGPDAEVTFTASLEIGKVYYLVIDGCSGDICNVELNIDPIEAVTPPGVGSSGLLQGPVSTCPNATVNYCIDPVDGATQYVWTIPSDATINGLAGPGPVTLSGPDANCPEIKFGPSSGSKQVCVRPGNVCNLGQQRCKVVSVQKLPDNVFPSQVVCIAEADSYELPWGEPISSNPGTFTYQATLPSYLGCDSIVKQTVTVIPPKIVNLVPKTICASECLTVGGEEFCSAGAYSITIPSFLGCDSVINFSIIKLNPTLQLTSTGNLSCNKPTVTLYANASNGTQKVWKNMAGQTLGAGDSLTVTTAGDYAVTVTASAGGTFCSVSDTITVSGSAAIPTANATATGYIGCTTTSVQLNVTTNAGNPLFNWSGPGGFSASVANPVATIAGTYNVTVTAPNGCTSTSTASVQANNTPPSAQASSDTLTCALTTVGILASTDAPDALFLWSGPGGFSATVADTSASLSGVYTVTVTNVANGCTTAANTTLQADIAPPALATGVSGPIACPTPTVTVSANTPDGISFAWNGPGGFVSDQQAPGVSVAGIYKVVVAGDNGCTATDSIAVSGDTNPPGAVATGDTLTCAAPAVVIQGQSGTTGAAFSWTGPGGFSSGAQNPTVNVTGDYLLTVSGPNGCTAVATAAVPADFAAPDAAASGGVITCADGQVTISGTSTTTGATFQWSGPGGFSAPQAAVPVGIPGDYVLTVAAPNGCTATATAAVTLEAGIPELSLTGDTLTCVVNSVLLDGGSTTPGVQFSWSGPNGFAATTEDVTVSVAGTYTLTAVDPTNGCQAVATTTLPLDDAAPGATASGDTLACSSPFVTLQGNSTIAGVSWNWMGPAGFVSSEQNPAVGTAGVYTLTAINPANGCQSTATATVEADLNVPQAAATGGTLTCAQTNLTLGGSTSLPGSFAWTGPGGFASGVQNPSVGQPGTYILTVTALNGCIDTAMTDVGQDITAPDLAAAGDTIDCISGQAVLNAVSMTPNVTWNWSGPNNFSSSQPSPATTTAGLYVLTATGPNGCSATATANVSLNTDAPVVSIGGVQELTCDLTTLTLTVSGMGPGISGQWDNGDPATTRTVNTPGTYTYTATASNGCVAAPSVLVLQNIQPPQNVSASGSELDCTVTVTSIAGMAGNQNVSWSWTGPGAYTSAVQNPADVTAPGTYTLQVTDLSNGCTATATAVVTQDVTPPVVSAAPVDTLTCAVQSVSINAGSNVPGTFSWSGPGNFSSAQEDPLVGQPGVYDLVVQAANGCTSTLAVSVGQNILPPGVTATGDTLTCDIDVINLSATTTAAGASYFWSGPQNFFSSAQNPPVSISGTFQVTVTGANGCTSTATAFVAQDVNKPLVSATGGTLTCAITSLTLASASSLPGDWQWTGPGGFTSTQSTPIVTVGGVYTAVVTTANGCTGSATASINVDNQAPVFNIGAPEELDCTTPEVTLQATVSGPGNFVFQWNTTTGNIVSGSTSAGAVVSLSGPYTLTVSNAGNGCSAAKTVVVPSNPDLPVLIASNVKNVTCFGDNDGSIRIDSVAGGTPPMLFALNGGAFSSTTVYQGLAPGTYQILLLDAAGCELETSVLLTEPGPLTVSLGADTTLHLGDPILLPVQSAVNDPLRVTELMTGPLSLSSDSVVYPMRSFIYTLSVSDNNRCRASDERLIRVDRSRLVYIPNVFNPDGVDNALFRIFGGQDVRLVRTFRIYDRWGALVHSVERFTPDDLSAGWSGVVNGEKATPAVFIYFAEIEFIDGEVEIFTGDVTLMR